MKLTRLTPELMVEDVNKTVKYYVEILGFELTNKVGEEKMVWANVMWKGSEAGLMFMEKEALSEDISEFKGRDMGGSVVLFIEMEGINDLYEKVRGRAEIVQEMHETFYGTKEFTMKDPNGYILAFAERISK